jgi:transcriptional regulator with XRE-family HTH domain
MGFQLPINLAAQDIRDAVGWTKKRMAAEIGVNQQLWHILENGKKSFSLAVIERIREVTGIDPYVLAYARYYNTSKLPEPVQKIHAELKDEWEKAMELMRRNRQYLPTSWY